MQLFYEIFPVFLFFLAFKFYDIYVATVVGIVATLAQVLLSRFLAGKWDNKQLITLGVFVFFGGMTLYFHNPIFVKWKPTIVFWVFALVIVGYQLIARRSLMQRLMQNMLQDKGAIPIKVWKRLDFIWALFFSGLGCMNLYIAYYFSNDAWVNFKFYGVTGALFLFSIFQAFYLMRYLSDKIEH
ncbi:septation protein A [Aquicella lusitana]|uniref:Inner membrane-spanning protein YciB n=1 Tax=Aquicella lusitana TaxID=254246 RepID=A0A370GQP3_9COXI|nr:septation protein A [Aquicella lusitana]RDI46038.1 intracellular septation protein [Aquicella lusitana]VVC73365.1 Intracellular septation protein [Aquicella lusitana]